MPRFAAILLNSKGKAAARICSVTADDAEEAAAEIERQLNRPGRRGSWRCGERMAASFRRPSLSGRRVHNDSKVRVAR